MYKTVYATNIFKTNYSHEFQIEFPRICPHCNTGIEPRFVDAYYVYESKYDQLYALFYCPVCDRCFVGTYGIGYIGADAPKLHLWNLLPYGESKTAFSSSISELSPSFIKIYHQSEKAEQIGLDEICGIGYRKALEFLIKDFAISSNPDDTEKIQRQNLAPCISEYMDNPKIKTLATASAWIGNDETHYVRKHEDYDVANLKAFISAMVSYIDSEILVLKAEALLKHPKR